MTLGRIIHIFLKKRKCKESFPKITEDGVTAGLCDKLKNSNQMFTTKRSSAFNRQVGFSQEQNFVHM